MKIFLAVMGFAGLMAGILIAAAASDAGSSPALDAPGRELDHLLGELADESFQVREQASTEIWKQGEAALPALREAATSMDPEQVFRARELIRKIQLHITPDTDPAVIALVERYTKASPSEKVTLFAKMKAKRAWRQMLKLFAAESRPDVRERLQPAVNGIAIKAGRERLYQGNAEEAREFLEMAPANAESLLALAEFHRSHGSLEAELTRAREIKGRKSKAWQLALHRAAGDLAAAKEAADECGELQIAAAMAALAGDPLPWLLEVNDLGGESEPDPAGVSYAALAAKRWQGRNLRPPDLEPLARRLASRNPMDRVVAMNAMFLLGEVQSAESVFAKTAPLAAFRYYEALERIPEAFGALGLDPQRPDFKGWVQQRLEKLPAEEIEDQREPSLQAEEIVALANFLERRGLHEEALAAFAEPLTALAANELETFVEILGKLFGNRETLSGAPLLASRVGIAWAGDDDGRWDEIVLAAFGDDQQTQGWWQWLADMAPETSRPERFNGMRALVGLGADPTKLREKWLAAAWAEVAAAPANRRDPLVARISAIAIHAGDVATSLKAWDEMAESSRKEVFWGEHVLHLSAADRWHEAAEVFLSQIAQAKESRQDPSVQFHAYAASSLRQAGRHEEAAAQDLWVDRLVLGNVTVAVQVGNGYAFGRDYRRAADWWARAARLADPATAEFAVALNLHSEVLTEVGSWHQSAAINEVLCRIYGNSDFRFASPLPLTHQRLAADLARALDTLPSKRAGALAMLAKCHRQFASDGSLADVFFPALRQAGLIEQHDAWFGETWNLMEEVVASYPHSDNTRNTAAWFASRSLRNLDEAEAHLVKALAANPTQSAYLDTMAEIEFARGQRDKALEWSRLAVNYLPNDPQLRRQQHRFRAAPLPK